MFQLGKHAFQRSKKTVHRKCQLLEHIIDKFKYYS